jgi:hypothetical protein
MTYIYEKFLTNNLFTEFTVCQYNLASKACLNCLNSISDINILKCILKISKKKYEFIIKNRIFSINTKFEN